MRSGLATTVLVIPFGGEEELATTTPLPAVADRVDHDRPFRRGAAPLAGSTPRCPFRIHRTGGVENVTCGASLRDMPSPMPYTRVSASMEPKGPHRSRLSTMRAAREGPIHGRDSIVSALAVSRSTSGRGLTSLRGCDVGWVLRQSGVPGGRDADRALVPADRDRRALRTRAIWASSASTSGAVGWGRACRDFTTRATTPRAAMAVMTARARRSAAVEGTT
jgi:hypothetical protein